MRIVPSADQTPATRRDPDQTPRPETGEVLDEDFLLETSQRYLIAPPRPERLRLNHLHLDDGPGGYQRDLDPRGERHVARIVREFDPNLLMLLIVNRRVDGTYWVIDGSHRLRALRQLWRSQAKVDVWLYEGLSREQEAELFVSQQRDRRDVNAVNLAEADLASGKDDAIGAARVLRRHGLSLETEQTYPRYQDGAWINNVVAVPTIRNLYQSAGEEILDQVVATLDAVWGKTEPKAYGAPVLVGLTGFLNAYHDHPGFKPQRLVAKLRETTLPGVTRAILFHYNRHLKSAQRAQPPWDTLLASVRTYRFRTRREGQS